MIIQSVPERLAEKAAWLIVKEGVEKLLKEQELVVMAVPGGRNAAPVFAALAKLETDWARVHLFMLDERLVAIDHREANYRLVHEQLGSCLPASSLHPFIYEPDDQEGSIARYNLALAGVGGKFDIVFASSGEDGHIGSLFPGHPLLDRDAENYVLLDNSPKPPAGRMTATLAMIKRASVGLVMIVGEGKQEAMNRFVDPGMTLTDCPAKVIGLLPKYFVLTDREVPQP